MLNGVPGRWITCRRGLRRGDPISPYLFIIVADVLQRLIQKASTNGDLCHPLNQTLPCPVLQYANDTLILTKGDTSSMTVLKQILDDFSFATGLTINFHKSTFVPMHVPDMEAAAMATVLGCSISSFPQTYLGLPLSPHKLRVADYKPLIDSFDRFLTGWKAKLLSFAGRLILVNAVLGGLTIYFMSSHLLPKTVLERLDARRRALLWMGEDKCNGSQCLIKWTHLLQTKDCGGLGIKNLEDQNHCLLLKFVHKLHEPASLPWKTWFSRHSSLSEDSFLNRLVQHELPLYQTLTRIRVGNGEHTSFWYDKWLFNTTLAHTFPALCFHYTDTSGSVREVVAQGLLQHHRSRLTNAASEEFTTLLNCTQLYHFSEHEDLHFPDGSLPKPFSTRGAYLLMHEGDAQNPDLSRIWQTKLPGKLQIFGWLLPPWAPEH